MVKKSLIKKIGGTWMVLVLFVMVTVAFAADSTQIEFPKGVVVDKDFDFGEIIEGEVVTHAFVIFNQSTKPLRILKVKTTCGCTTAEKPDRIEPGQKGHVTVKFHTRGYGGRNVIKNTHVTTDDPDQKLIVLTIKGRVTRFARILPDRLLLRGVAGKEIKGLVRIVPEPNYPFQIEKVVIDTHISGKIAANLKADKGIYLLEVSNLVRDSARYYGKVILKTDSPLRPELTVYVIGRIEKQ
ncbi:DUF1573 domain-containing protein [Desulfotignum phosphitoxidans]|uniref:DUF1573 domain-containing protein n=1 Tax=Desulfotignum phosphitoxidans DSM 13687 TaxID=1286635 RepID=S0G7S0_9BACT|nr:DUF1573 domain-containing protein [Desulfotignum phosphitoxidans]EMS81412.1 hypothetical protein, DUF1573 [Desulfotignum phosphitoxidans DSM 13687]